MTVSLAHAGQAPAAPSRLLFDEHWGRPMAEPDPGNLRRIATIAALCPQVDALLEVGCGSGDVLDAVAHKARQRVGCDTSGVGVMAAMRRQPPEGVAPVIGVQAA